MGSQYILPSGGGGPGPGGGDVVGPGSSIPNSFPIFGDGTGKLLADSTLMFGVGAGYIAIYPDTVNDDLVVAPNGDGALQGQAADGLPSGGDPRGAYATDWQRVRTYSVHVAAGAYSVISGGADNYTQAPYSTVVGGLGAHATHYGEVAFASGWASTPGDSQTSFATFRTVTTDANQAILTLDGLAAAITNEFEIPTRTSYKFRISVIARDTLSGTADSAWWEINGGIKRDLSNGTSLIGVNAITFAKDLPASTWTADVIAEDVTECLQIIVTGEVGKTIYWTATGQFTKITTPP